jgi:predicted PurR-regulated permease PerM
VTDPLEPESPNRSRLMASAERHNVPVRTILSTVAIVAATYLGALFLYRMRDLLLLMLVGGFIALLLNPLVLAFERWGLKRRGAAVGVVALISLLIFSGLAFAFGYPLVRSLTHLADTLPTYVKQAQQGRGWIGHLLRQYHVDTWVTKNSSKLVSLAQGLSKPALAVGKGAASMLVMLLTVFTFVVLLLMEAPKLRTVVLEAMSPARAERVSRLSAEVRKAASGYMVGNLATSIIAGVVVFVALALLGVPFALLFALWVALVDFLPTIGGALAGIPTVLFAFGHSIGAGVVTFIVFMVYTQLENHVLNPVIMAKSVKLNPFAVFLAVLFGAEVGAWIGGIFGGFVGVLLAVPLAATGHVIARDLWPRVKAGA